MTRKQIIALADAVRELPVFTTEYVDRHRASNIVVPMFRYQDVVDSLADFCKQQNTKFNRKRWLGYVGRE